MKTYEEVLETLPDEFESLVGRDYLTEMLDIISDFKGSKDDFDIQVSRLKKNVDFRLNKYKESKRKKAMFYCIFATLLSSIAIDSIVAVIYSHSILYPSMQAFFSIFGLSLASFLAYLKFSKVEKEESENLIMDSLYSYMFCKYHGLEGGFKLKIEFTGK
jgi:hypothetical protein